MRMLGRTVWLALLAQASQALLQPQLCPERLACRTSQARLLLTCQAASLSEDQEATNDSTLQEASQAEDVSDSTSEKKKDRVALLVCPAQFCVPADYEVLFDNLCDVQQEANDDEDDSVLPRVQVDTGASVVVPLGRTDWIKVARQLPTPAFVQGTLDVKETLGWYFDAIEEGFAQIFAATAGDEEVKVCVIGHSIGGWVARAYLGGLSHSSSAVHRLAVERCSSLLTLGTPQTSPDSAWVDQTRGLLRAIEDTPSCSPQALLDAHGIAMTCVGSNAIASSVDVSDALNVEKWLALGSYLPLTGQTNESGDGIVPSSLAYLPEPAQRVTLDNCRRTGLAIRHSHVVPTPWNVWDSTAPSIALPVDEYPSYVSKGVVEQWARFIQ